MPYAASCDTHAASKAVGGPIYGRLINTSSEPFLFGAAGQPTSPPPGPSVGEFDTQLSPYSTGRSPYQNYAA